jgi:hypothetical protein
LTQTLPGAKNEQSESLEQMGGLGGLFHPMAGEQKQQLSIRCTQKAKQGTWQKFCGVQGSGVHPVQGSGPQPDWANAGVLMLVKTGAVHAIAAPAPIRFSILRREVPAYPGVSALGPRTRRHAAEPRHELRPRERCRSPVDSVANRTYVWYSCVLLPQRRREVWGCPHLKLVRTIT